MFDILEYPWETSQLISNKENILTTTLRDFIISKINNDNILQLKYQNMTSKGGGVSIPSNSGGIKIYIIYYSSFNIYLFNQ